MSMSIFHPFESYNTICMCLPYLGITVFFFGCVFATGMVIYSRLIKPPGRTAEMLPPWRYCMFRNCLTDALSRRPAPFTPIKGRITHLYNCCNLIPQDWLMSQR